MGRSDSTQINTLGKALRLELKNWEQSFAAAHQGRKAGREDIKQYPEIAHKYKQYNRLRRPTLDETPDETPPHNATSSKKRSPTESNPVLTSRSPHKRSKHTHPIQPSIIPTHDPPSPTFKSPRVHRTSIGPTPQKDGQVLGLFDQVSTTSSSQTPRKREALRPVRGNTLTTPCKRSQQKYPKETEIMHLNSPPSRIKSNHHNSLVTPSIRRATDCSTPASRSEVSKLRFDETPAFLRRDSQRGNAGKADVMGDEEGVSWSPVAIHKLPKAAGRGLSALVRGLREMEDEGLDEELNMLREMESESAPQNHVDQSRVLVNDSQRPEMPLGPDDYIESDRDGVEYTDKGERKGGKSVKVWKKKGQKRTTRRVLMKPNTAKWKPEPAWVADQLHESDQDSAAERKGLSADRTTDWKEGGYDDGSENVEDNKEIMEARIGNRGAIDVNSEKLGGSAKKAKKAKKKISATAHANFKALNIKNRQSKGRKGGRLGRKR